MERKLAILIEDIFSDAHVVDVDFSGWDKAIDIYVLADHVPRVGGDLLALFRVSFVRVDSFLFETSPGLGRAQTHLTADEHVQWRIDDCRIREEGGQTTMAFAGSESSPRLEIVCGEVEVQPVAHSVFDELFPNWSRPRSGLARPGPLRMKAAGSSDT